MYTTTTVSTYYISVCVCVCVYLYVFVCVSYLRVGRITSVRRRRRWLWCADRGFSRARSDVTRNSNRGWRVDSLWLLSSLLFRLRAIVLVVVGDNKHVYSPSPHYHCFSVSLSVSSIHPTTLSISSIPFSNPLHRRIL